MAAAKGRFWDTDKGCNKIRLYVVDNECHSNGDKNTNEQTEYQRLIQLGGEG